MQKMAAIPSERVLGFLLRGSVPALYSEQALVVELTVKRGLGWCDPLPLPRLRDPLHPDAVTPAVAFTPQSQARGEALLLQQSTKSSSDTATRWTARVPADESAGSVDGWITFALPARWDDFCALDVAGTVTLGSNVAPTTIELQPLRIDSRDDLDGTFDNVAWEFELDTALWMGLSAAVLTRDLPPGKIENLEKWRSALTLIETEQKTAYAGDVSVAAPAGVCYAAVLAAQTQLDQYAYQNTEVNISFLDTHPENVFAYYAKFNDSRYRKAVAQINEVDQRPNLTHDRGVRQTILKDLDNLSASLLAIGDSYNGLFLGRFVDAARLADSTCTP